MGFNDALSRNPTHRGRSLVKIIVQILSKWLSLHVSLGTARHVRNHIAGAWFIWNIRNVICGKMLLGIQM